MALHDLRHTYAMLAIQEGIPVLTVTETMGHHSAAFIMEVYTHVTKQMRDGSTQKTGALLDSCMEG